MSDLTTQLADQLDYHWTNQLRPRLDGLTDEEYFWQPVPDCWTVHPDGSIDFTYPPPQPEPFTTIAWRLAHVIVGVLAMRNHFHFGGPPADYQSWNYATDAKTALQQLDDAYANWITAYAALMRRRWRGPSDPTKARGPTMRCRNLSCTSTGRSSTTAPKSLASEIFTHTPPTERERQCQECPRPPPTSARRCSSSCGSTRTRSSRWPTA